MPVSRYFGHYVGQFYKIGGRLPPAGDGQAVRRLFQEVVRKALEREFFGVLCNSLSACAFTFVLFSEEGQGVALDGSDLLVRTLACYGLETDREELAWYAESFWSRSIAHKLSLGWLPPSAAGYPHRVFEVLSLSLGRPAAELCSLMDELIAEWKRQAAEVLYRHGHPVPGDWW
jgi:aldehyde:ferredoxin oxidoreductase